MIYRQDFTYKNKFLIPVVHKIIEKVTFASQIKINQQKLELKQRPYKKRGKKATSVMNQSKTQASGSPVKSKASTKVIDKAV